ncbi:MAG: hypothetical protein HUK26_07625, partial [Duodenibacillus sp.]|nr:hypothetical protein [Duodenibacillus sp.]
MGEAFSTGGGWLALDPTTAWLLCAGIVFFALCSAVSLKAGLARALEPVGKALDALKAKGGADPQAAKAE